MGDKFGGLAFLPLPNREPDRDAFLSEVLTGWKRSHLAQNFTLQTTKRRVASVMRLSDFSGKYPWEWGPVDADELFAHLRGVENLALSTVRAYQTDIKLFCEYATNPEYPWNENCGRLFGTTFSQVITEFNKARHVQDADMGPEKRAFTLEELQAFFDLADLEVERIINSGRKGALAAWRDAVAFKTAYGWGLRRDELRHLSLVDFSRNVKAPYFGDYGILRVRFGKPQKGSPKKQRSVLTLLDWAAEAVDDWVRRGLPRYGQPVGDLFPTDRGGLVPEKNLRARMRGFLDELGFPPGLDLHSLRRSYVTHMQTEHGYDTKFISMQVGHEHTSTTTIYTLPSPDYAARELERVLNSTLLASNSRVLTKPTTPSGKTPR
nr:site-specific integrase [Arthrobacter sp. AK-1]